MNEKISLTPEEEKIIKKISDEAKTIKREYEKPEIKRLYEMLKDLGDYYGFDIIEKAIIFLKNNLKNTPEDELRKHTLYHIISGSSPIEGEHVFSDYTQENIDKDPKIKRFVEDDLKMKKFIENEYETMINRKATNS